jgi:hypothetical protein
MDLRVVIAVLLLIVAVTLGLIWLIAPKAGGDTLCS